MDHQTSTEVFLPVVVLFMVFTAGTIIPISITWQQNRTKMRAIEVLKIYAEKGQEPPQSVLEAVNRISWPFPQNAPPRPMRDQSRAEHLYHLAGNVFLAAGSAIVIWWRAPEQIPDHPGPLMIIAVVCTIFFTASAAVRLVAALTAGDGKR